MILIDLETVDVQHRIFSLFTISFKLIFLFPDWLLSECADVSVQDKSGYNVLHYACNHSNEAAALV